MKEKEERNLLEDTMRERSTDTHMVCPCYCSLRLGAVKSVSKPKAQSGGRQLQPMVTGGLSPHSARSAETLANSARRQAACVSSVN